MSNNTNEALTAGASAGSGEDGGIERTIGFVAEFNTNVALFQQLVWSMLVNDLVLKDFMTNVNTSTESSTRRITILERRVDQLEGDSTYRPPTLDPDRTGPQ